MILGTDKGNVWESSGVLGQQWLVGEGCGSALLTGRMTGLSLVIGTVHEAAEEGRGAMIGGRGGLGGTGVGALWGNVGESRLLLGLPGRRGGGVEPEFAQGSGGSEKTMP